MNVSNIYFDKRQGKLTKIGETICSYSVISEYRVFQNWLELFKKFNTGLIFNNLILTCTEKSCAYLDSTSNFLLENVYFDYGRVSNKKLFNF